MNDGIERLPEVEDNKTPKKKIKAYPIGYFHIDIAEVRTAEGKFHLFVAIDLTSKFAYVELHQKATIAVSKQFMNNLVAAVPYKIRTVLTDNIQFTDPTGESWTSADMRKIRAEGKLFRCNAFKNGCAIHDIDHRLPKPKHPWTNDQVERMNRTIKQATVHCYHYDSYDHLRQHLTGFVKAYNFAGRLKALKGLTPYEFICKCWANQPERFNLNPIH